MRLCVFCGSSSGTNPIYTDAARALGRALTERNIGLVYGGGRVGLMGTLANAVLGGGAGMGLGGEVTGIIPRALWEREIGHTGLSDLHIVGSMHERKAMMADLSDGFIALPGGLGTLEELFEVWTWWQLGLHRKPVALLNVGGYFTALTSFLDSAVTEGFVSEQQRNALIVDDECARLLDRVVAASAASHDCWPQSRSMT